MYLFLTIACRKLLITSRLFRLLVSNASQLAIPFTVVKVLEEFKSLNFNTNVSYLIGIIIAMVIWLGVIKGYAAIVQTEVFCVSTLPVPLCLYNAGFCISENKNMPYLHIFYSLVS